MDVELTSVRCNHCGAPIEAAAATKFVTCGFCKSALVVKHTGTSAFTEVVEELAGHTRQMASNLKVIELQNDLERLDREWGQEKGKQVQAESGNGAGVVAFKVMAVIIAVMMGAFGIFFAKSASSLGAPWIFTAFGAGFVAFAAVFVFMVLAGKSGGIGGAETAHQHRRAALLQEIEAAKKQRS